MIRRWREIERWIEDEEGKHQSSFAEHPLSDFITRKVVGINRSAVPLAQLNVIAKISFGGDLHIRTSEGKRGYKGPLFYAHPGDLVISKIRVAQGSLCIVPDELEHLAVSAEYPVYSINPERVSGDFIRLVIRSSAFRQRISRLRSGNTTKARIRPAQFEELKVPLPSLDEQRTFVGAYADALKRAAVLEQEANAIEQAGVLAFESALGVTSPPLLPDRPVFIARFKELERWSHDGILRAAGQRNTVAATTWTAARLGDVIADLENGWSPKCHGHPARDGKWGVLKVGAVSFATFDENQNKELPDRLKARVAFEVKDGDVLISRANVVKYVGACAYVERTRPKLLLCDKIFRVRFKDNSELVPQFLTEAMRLPSVRAQIEERLTGTSPTMKNISKPALLDLSFPLPPSDDQQVLVSAITAARSKARARRAEAKTLRESAWTTFESSLFDGES